MEKDFKRKFIMKNQQSSVKRIKKINNNPGNNSNQNVEKNKDLEKVIEDSIHEVSKNEEFNEFWEQKENGKGNPVSIDNLKLYELLLHLQESVNKVNTNVTNRKEENINVIKMIFDKIKFISTHMKKWFIGILVISFICGGITFTVIYHNWDQLAPILDKIVGITKIANNVSNIPK